MRRQGADVGAGPSRPLLRPCGVVVGEWLAAAVALSAAVQREQDAQHARDEADGPDVLAVRNDAPPDLI